LDGLEAVEVKSNQVFTKDLRLEAKYYSSKIFLDKEFLFAGDILESSNYNSIYGLNTKGLGYPVLRMNEFETLFTGSPSQHSENFSEDDFKVHRLQKDDILICRTNGNPNLIGKSALVARDYPYVYESHLFKVRANRQMINSATLCMYLNTKYGRSEIDRLSMQGNQANFSLSKFKEIRVPKLSTDFSNIMEEKIYLSFEKLQHSKTLYKQAENLLLEELGLLDLQPTTQSVSIKSFSESFGSSGRLDSEYYQPKYETIINHITNTEYKKLSELVNIHKSIEPGSNAYQEEGIPFVRVSNLTKFGLSEPDIHLAEDIVDTKTMKELIPKKDTILLSKDGTVGIAYAIKNETEMITSGAILHLTRKDESVQVEYLTLVLNSMLVQMQSERDAGGSIIKHWKPSEIAEVLIPIIDKSIQIKIEENIKTSFTLKEESKALLELAKRAVEVAIEEGEDVAMEMIHG
jgi:restriction endonuclease S subunit